MVQEVNTTISEIEKFLHEVEKLAVKKTRYRNHEHCKEDIFKAKGFDWKYLHEDVASFNKEESITP